MRLEKEAIYVKTLLYADVLASAVQGLEQIPPALVGPLRAYLECRQINGHSRQTGFPQDGLQYKNGDN